MSNGMRLCVGEAYRKRIYGDRTVASHACLAIPFFKKGDDSCKAPDLLVPLSPLSSSNGCGLSGEGGRYMSRSGAIWSPLPSASLDLVREANSHDLAY